MITTLFILVAAVVFLFGFVVWLGPPYLPTLKKQSKTTFELLGLKSGDTLLELGSGDGRMAREAARRGIRVIGIELNPLLVLYGKLATWRYRHLVSIRWGSFWAKSWPKDVDGIYVFLLDKFMAKLDKKIIQTYSGKSVKLVSFAFQVPGKSPRQEKDGLYLYHYK